MKIYVSHSSAFNFQQELYQPLLESELAREHQFVFPHEVSLGVYPSKQLFAERGCDSVLAEVSLPSHGVGIELGWADAAGIRIICVYKQDNKISGSLKMVSKDFLVYRDSADLIAKLSKKLKI